MFPVNFYILGSFGNGSYKYKVEKALGAQKIKTRGKEDLCTEVGGTLEEFSQLICVWGGRCAWGRNKGITGRE